MLKRLLPFTLVLASCGATEDAPDVANEADVEPDVVEPQDTDALTVEVAPDAEPDLVPDVAEGPICLSAEATGAQIGQVPEDVVLQDCEGNEVRLRSLCEERAAWVFIYTGWCPPCQTVARQAQAFANRFAGEGFASYFVISETQEFSEPDAEYCAGIREQFRLTMPVLIDPGKTLPAAVDNPYFDIDVVLGPGNELLFADQHSDRDDVAAVIEAALAE